MYAFFKLHLIKAFSATFPLYTSWPPPQTNLVPLCWRRLMPFHIFFFLKDFSAFFSMIGPKLCVPVTRHISLDILLTCLVVSTTYLVYLRVTWTPLTFGCTPAPASLHQSQVPPAFSSPFLPSPPTPPSLSRFFPLWKPQKNLWHLGALVFCKGIRGLWTVNWTELPLTRWRTRVWGRHWMHLHV